MSHKVLFPFPFPLLLSVGNIPKKIYVQVEWLDFTFEPFIHVFCFCRGTKETTFSRQMCSAILYSKVWSDASITKCILCIQSRYLKKTDDGKAFFPER
jgi:hypothetical protein